MTITSLWALLCSVVLVPHNLDASAGPCNPARGHVRFRAQMVQSGRKTKRFGMECAFPSAHMLPCVLLKHIDGVSIRSK